MALAYEGKRSCERERDGSIPWVAQCPSSSMDRAGGFYPSGWGFESLLGHMAKKCEQHGDRIIITKGITRCYYCGRALTPNHIKGKPKNNGV